MAKRKKTSSPKKSAETKPPAGAEANPGAGYTVLARRYRSRDFDELIGQEPIARTLQNAIKSGRVAHAYLFCGTRGVGKTSMARIFAKALNVTEDLKEKDRVADAIMRGEDLDVIEIDAASNRGIDNARDVIAGAGLSPARCRYKVYIIDEVHMLTPPAFNALLKTMEEPPAHVKFILCTTESHKVPQTIQSRCQRFDFRPIPTQRIADQLRMILKNEGVEADDGVIISIAQLGNGSMRDALSMLDRILATGERELSTEMIEQMIGLPDQALMMDLVDAIISQEAGTTLEKGDVLIRRGASVEQILDLLATHWRNLMVISACGDESPLLEMPEETRRRAQTQAQAFDTAGLVHMVALCDAVAQRVKTSGTARALFDAAIIRMAQAEHFADVASLLRGEPAASSGKKKALNPPPGETVRPAAMPRVTEVKPASPPATGPSRMQAANSPQSSGTTPDAPKAKGAASSAAPVDPTDGAAIWARLREAAATKSFLQVKIDLLDYVGFDGRTLRLALVSPQAAGSRLITAQTMTTLESLVRESVGINVRIEIVSEENAPAGSSAPRAAENERIRLAREDPAVKKAMEIFDATIIDVQDQSHQGG
ncbi:MAG: DNA polymerase III subunit gamma/tau [Phycisphaerales bacterium]|nr:MAG: DNA polymerase III subunit gamma/tau [Phycisphaerales bacterium]